MTREEVLEAAMTAFNLKLRSIAIQSGENSSVAFIDTIEELISTIRRMTDNKLGITLSRRAEQGDLQEMV